MSITQSNQSKITDYFDECRAPAPRRLEASAELQVRLAILTQKKKKKKHHFRSKAKSSRQVLTTRLKNYAQTFQDVLQISRLDWNAKSDEPSPISNLHLSLQ